MSRPDDSFERRFALEQAVKFADTPNAKFTGREMPSVVVIAIADRFLEFLKGDTK